MPHGDAPDRGGADPCGDGPPEGPPEGWRGVFLTALRETGNVSAAARRAGTSRSVCYGRRRRDSGFAAAWEDALEEAADRLEMEAFRRAVDGVGEDRFFGGYVVGRSVEKISPQIAAGSPHNGYGHNGHGQSGQAHKATPTQKPRPKQPSGPTTRVPARKK